MSVLFRLFGTSIMSVGLCALVCAAQAATGRDGYANVRSTSAMGASSGRMPSMPTLTLNSVGNISATLPSSGKVTGGNSGAGNSTPDTPSVPTVTPTKCPDGGVENSEYGINECMGDLLTCINNGALPNGLNDMFNVDLRNSIVNGMGLCNVYVDRCISDVRRDCKNVYNSVADVWLDFNSRKVQPEYYNFVLRKTGLTPNQAENTCLLLDRNTFGTSFAAVNDNGNTTNEFNNRVYAFNGSDGQTKQDPLGVEVEKLGVDSQRGHYARWDATDATCYVRVAAYNKDKHISNSWLFGGIGDEKPAEVWKAAGDVFTCNKDLFGFSLMNDTKTVALIGGVGGTALGAGIGAAVGHGARSFDCDKKNHRELLGQEIVSDRNVAILNEYLEEDIQIGTPLKEKTCKEVLKLYDLYSAYQSHLSTCGASSTAGVVSSGAADKISFNCTKAGVAALNDASCLDLVKRHGLCVNANNYVDCAKELLESSSNGYSYSETLNDGVVLNISYTKGAADVAASEQGTSGCSFKALNKDLVVGEDGTMASSILCSGGTSECVEASVIRDQLRTLNNVFNDSVADIIQNGEKGNRAKTTAAGAAIGLGAGGIATAITAFVENSNIHCRVGDGLEKVGLGKSYSIDSLKDFYVKWNLRLPDVIAPTATVTDCASWQRTCAMFTDLKQCVAVEINYKPADATTATLVRSACVPSGSACIENASVARTYGACK